MFGYCPVLHWSLLDDWASRYEAWNIAVASGSIIRKRDKMSVLYPEIRENTNQKSSTGDSAYSYTVLLRDYGGDQMHCGCPPTLAVCRKD